jgi:hypothetical protein
MKEEEKIESDYKAYDKGFKAGKEHSKPSPETLTYMENVKIQIADLKEDLKDIPRKADMELFVTKAITIAINESICTCDKKYAPKYVGSVVIWLLITIGGTVLVSLIKFIFEHITLIANR